MCVWPSGLSWGCGNNLNLACLDTAMRLINRLCRLYLFLLFSQDMFKSALKLRCVTLYLDQDIAIFFEDDFLYGFVSGVQGIEGENAAWQIRQLIDQ